MHTVYMEGPKLNLVKNRAGKTNWDDLLVPKTERPVVTEVPAAPIGSGIAALTVGGIDIRNGEIHWQDQTTGTRYAARDLELKTGKIVPGRPVDLRLDFDLQTDNSPPTTWVRLEIRANLDLARQTLDVPSLTLNIDELALTWQRFLRHKV